MKLTMHVLSFIPEVYAKLSKSPVTTSHGNYIVFHRRVQHVTAHLVCSIVGHLVVIDDQTELDQLNQTARYWIDMNDVETEGTWVSSFTGDASFLSWGFMEPAATDPGNEDCGVRKDST